jgi:PAS domain S-box-containing protein
VLIEKKRGKMTKRTLIKSRSMKPRPLLLNPERKYKYLYEDGSAIMLMIGADGSVKDVNNALLEISGYSRDEIVGKNAIDFVVPEHKQKTAAQIQAAVSKGAAPQFEVMFRSKDGSTRTLLLPPTQLVLEEEGQRSFLVMGVDITERAKYETRLQTLHTHASQLSSAAEIDTIIKCTLDAMEFTLGFEHAYFLLVEKDSLQIKESRGRPVVYSAQPLDGRGVTVKAANTKTTLKISDTRKEPAFVDPKGYDWTEPPTVLSELVVPVLIDAEAVAVLCVDSLRLDAFSDEDQKLLETLAIHVGLALGRLRHEEELEIMARFPAENPNPILRLDRRGTVLSANQASEALLQDWGSGIGQAAPKSWCDLVTDVRSCGEGRDIDIEFGGRSYTFLVKPIVEGDYVNLYGRDITERKRAEEKLSESEERYRSLFDRMLDGVYLSTHEGRFVDVNSAFVKMFGYSSKQEMLDITNIKKELYFSPEERGSHLLDTGQEEVEVYRMRRKDGSEVWVEDHGGYVHDEHGNIIYHEGILRDISERKRLEEELKQYSLHLEESVEERTRKLRESEEKYRELFEACPVSLWEEDFSAVKQFLDELRQKGVSDFGAYFAKHPKDVAKCAALVKVLNVNEATLKLYNAKSVDEITGGLSGVLKEESSRAFAGELVALAQGKTYYEGEIENRTLRGEKKDCNLICAVVPSYEQSLAKVLVCLVDLTPQKMLEAELVKSQRLAAIGETAAMVGHDLRNPLQGIAGAVHLLQKESLTAKERDEMLELIQDSVEYGDTIVRDLSDYSAAEIQLKLAEATPKSITRDAIGAVKIPEYVTVQDLSEDQPTLRVDPDRMKRVFINLIENAIDAMPQGGTLTISSRKSGDNVEIVLTDTGSGIPEKVMENLWKPLQTTKAKGLGLGLPICKRIMDAHGGSMSVNSEVGRGTTLTIQLPIRPVEVKQK